MRVISGLVTLNAAVFFAWQVPQLQGFMMRHFLQFPSDGGRGITMLTAAFSHMSPMHLGMNMLGLVSFGGILGSVFASPDQRSSPGGARFREHSDPWAGAWELAAFFVAGCMASSFASQANSVRLFAKTAGKSVAPSLGASGGVYGIVTAVALVFPWTGVHVLFFPVSLRLGTVLPILLSLDFAGVVLKWQTFDHAAHLGGAAFGYMFMKWGGREAYLDLRKRIRARLSGGVTAKE
ncbi:hypothetical protein DFJ74DRAFT_601197 [Hyaloraphidium curvatum]|nr:hypothetical protein DFJ74DRAFT_601197 [Hyaloraphidium curvatum]